MRKQTTYITLIILLLLTSVSVAFGENKYGKFFIKAATTLVDSQQIPVEELERAARGVKSQFKPINLVDQKSEADYLILVNECIAIPQSGSPSAVRFIAVLYIRKNGELKPAVQLKSDSDVISWPQAAESLAIHAVRWIDENSMACSVSK